MWEAVKEQREKKSRMVTVDMQCKLQAEKCPESGDIRAHLHKLQAMQEDLTSMGGSISDEDFTSLSPMNLIDAICDEVDRCTIKNPKSKKDEQDAAFVAGQSTGKGKKGGEGSKKPKKGQKCYNCKKLGHFMKDCWAPGGGAEGKGPRGKGKDKEVEVKADDKGGSDSDAVWMVLTSDKIVDNGDKVISRGSRGECNLWTEDEISDNDNFKVINHSSVITNTGSNDSLDNFFLEISVDNEDINSVEDLIMIMDTSEDSVLKADREVSEVALDLDEELKTSTFAAAILANSVSSTIEIELFNLGMSQHMSPLR